MRVYAIGDIHGQMDALRRAHDLIDADRAATGDDLAPVIHLGDLCDRGPDSRGVIEFILKGISEGRPWDALKGNHDRMFSRFLDIPEYREPQLRPGLDWLDERLGGGATLASYGVEILDFSERETMRRQAVELVPDSHRDFLQSRPTFVDLGDVAFVHAGIRPGIPLDRQTEEDLIWIRDGFLDDTTDHGALIVHGHTALDAPAHFGNRIDLDTGAGYGRALTGAVFEGRDCYILSPTGRIPLLPGTS